MWSRTFAGTLLGALAAFALCGLFAYLTPAGWASASIAVITVFPALWLGLIAAAFTTSTPRRAWLWLGTAALAAWAALWLVRAWSH